MGEKLVKYYQYVSEKGGLAAKVKFAAMTKVPSPQAAIEPDSPVMLEQFHRAAEAVTGQPVPKF